MGGCDPAERVHSLRIFVPGRPVRPEPGAQDRPDHRRLGTALGAAVGPLPARLAQYHGRAAHPGGLRLAGTGVYGLQAGAGAGADVTASGLFADIIKIASN